MTMRSKRITTPIKMMLLTFVREKSAIFFTFFFPVMLTVLFGFIFQGSEDATYTIHVIDQDDTEQSRNLTKILDSIKSVELKKVDNKNDIDKYMKDNKINFLLIIPEGYQNTIYRKMTIEPNATVNLTIKYDPTVQSTGIKLSLINSVLQEVNKGLVGAKDTINIETDSIVSENFDYIEFFIPGVIGLSVMTTVVFNTIFGEMENKQKGIIRKLSTTPITRGEWIFSNMVFQLFLAFCSIIIILLTGFLIFGVTLHINALVAIIIICEAFAFTGLAMLVTKGVKEASSASAIANVITFPMMFLSGSFFPVEQMPDFLQSVAIVLPLYYVNEGLRDAMLFNDLVAASWNALVIGVFAIIVFVAGILFTSWKQD